ncbi:hypothetical protein B296_00036650 [Ensete ventricosum]|uniref:Uncharacterized protein n=1 Tax=Ensete ventricosum TaxID=4639 RepID=A0A426Y802_ENSVE|nr:hypothetical protein B296_00036650 [Ensete ventricosum]
MGARKPRKLLKICAQATQALLLTPKECCTFYVSRLRYHLDLVLLAYIWTPGDSSLAPEGYAGSLGRRLPLGVCCDVPEGVAYPGSKDLVWLAFVGETSFLASTRAFIMGATSRSYLRSLLPLWLTMLSYFSTLSVVLGVRRAFCLLQLWRVGLTHVRLVIKSLAPLCLCQDPDKEMRARLENLRNSSKVWRDQATAEEFERGLLHLQLARELYTLLSEVLLARAAKEIVLINNLLQETETLKAGGGPEAMAAAEEWVAELEKELEKTQQEHTEALQRLETSNNELNKV